MADEKAGGEDAVKEVMEEDKDSDQDVESEGEDSDDEEYFEVECIISRKKQNGIFLYRVRWKGYPPSNDTWEPVENLEVVRDMVVEFDKREEEKNKARQEERRLRKLRMEGKKLPGEDSSSSEESSDDDKLLSEDVRFFKQLEKNKLLALDGTDLYSKVKSRTAVLAGKKKSGESKSESFQASSAKSSHANAKKAENRPKGGNKSNPGRRKRHVTVSIEKSASQTSVICISDSSNRESSSDSEGSKPLKTTGSGDGKKRGKACNTEKSASQASVICISESSYRESPSDSEGLRPLKTAGSEDGKERGKARKRPVSTSSGSSGDSDDSLPLARCKSSKSQPKCDRSRPKKRLTGTYDRDNVAASVDKADSIKAGSKQIEDTNISDSQRVEKKKKKPRKISSDSDSEKLSDLCSKMHTSISDAVAASSDISLSKMGEEFDTRLEKKSEGSKNKKSEKSLDSEKYESLMPTSQTKKKKDGKRLETTLTNASACEKKDASKKMESFTPALKDTTSLSPEDTAPVPFSKPQPRDLIPVLERFARQVPDFSSTVRNEKEEKVTVESAALLFLTKTKLDTAASGCEIPKETSNTDAESTDSKDFETKYPKGKSKERGKVSRKRKRDTDSEHVKAVNEGAASPVKAVSPQEPTSPADTGQVADGDSALSLTPASLSQKSAQSDSETDDLSTNLASSSAAKKSDKGVPPLKIAVPKLKTEPVRLKPESPKSQRHSPLFLVDTVKREQEKVKGEMLRSACRTSVKEIRSTSPSVGSKKDKLSGISGSNTKSDLAAKVVKPEAADSRSLRLELAAPTRVARPEVGEGSSPVQGESKPSGTELLESRKKSGLPSSSSGSVPASATDTGKDNGPNASVAGAAAGAGSEKDAPGRDHGLPGASGKDSAGPASRDPAPTAVPGGFTSSLYSGYRDSLSFPTARASGLGPAAAGRDGIFSSMPARDPTLTSVSPARDITLPSGYTHLTSSSSSGSSPVSYSPRSVVDTRTPAGTSRLGIAASPSITGKENADRSLGLKLSMSSPKMGSSAQPLDTILNSSLYAVEGEKSKHGRGLDSDFDTALHRTDLEYLEKLLLPPVTPMELSNEELRQAVVDGNYYLVRRALACAKQYNLNLPDSKGFTLLMNAVLKGYDDIIMQLLLNGADSEVQVNGVTSLMLAVEHAECSTVYMLLEMGAHVNTRDVSGETALFRAVMRGDKQILNKVLEHGADFAIKSRITGLDAVEVAKLHRLADVETTLLDHIQRVVQVFEEQVNLTVRGTARLVERLFPHHCVPLYENDTISIQFKFQPMTPSAPGTGCLLFIAHARFNQQEVKCRLYGQCAVVKVTLNGVEQPCLTEESNFVLMCHPLITGYNDLVIHTKRDITSRAKLIICAYKAQLIWR